MVVSHIGMDIKSINIVQVFLDSTCFYGITDHVESPIWLVVVPIVPRDTAFNNFSGIVPVPVSFPLSQPFTFCV